MSDQIMATVAMITMIAFLGTVVVFVPDVDLIIVILAVSGLAIYDFWTLFRAERETKSSE